MITVEELIEMLQQIDDQQATIKICGECYYPADLEEIYEDNNGNIVLSI